MNDTDHIMGRSAGGVTGGTDRSHGPSVDGSPLLPRSMFRQTVDRTGGATDLPRRTDRHPDDRAMPVDVSGIELAASSARSLTAATLAGMGVSLPDHTDAPGRPARLPVRQLRVVNTDGTDSAAEDAATTDSTQQAVVDTGTPTIADMDNPDSTTDTTARPVDHRVSRGPAHRKNDRKEGFWIMLNELPVTTAGPVSSGVGTTDPAYGLPDDLAALVTGIAALDTVSARTVRDRLGLVERTVAAEQNDQLVTEYLTLRGQLGEETRLREALERELAKLADRPVSDDSAPVTDTAPDMTDPDDSVEPPVDSDDVPTDDVTDDTDDTEEPFVVTVGVGPDDPDDSETTDTADVTDAETGDVTDGADDDLEQTPDRDENPVPVVGTDGEMDA